MDRKYDIGNGVLFPIPVQVSMRLYMKLSLPLKSKYDERFVNIAALLRDRRSVYRVTSTSIIYGDAVIPSSRPD